MQKTIGLFGIVLATFVIIGVLAVPPPQVDPTIQQTVDAAVAGLFTQTATAPTPLPMTHTVEAAFRAAQTATAQTTPEQERISINTATQEQLETLPRIGPVLAERIIIYREENGAYATLDDLGAVEGIGPATLEAIADLITFDE